jgi:nucleoside phosphorylase
MISRPIKYRKMPIIEPEGAGVARVCAERKYPIVYMIIRCVSDFSGKDKPNLENTTQDNNRYIEKI